jgi:phosphohistidine swiveling domain-containing protein/protein-tyrosine-phosphatase
MKAVKKVLFVHGDDCSLSPMFKAMLRRQVALDPVLSTAGLQVDSTGIEGDDGHPMIGFANTILKNMGIEEFGHVTKHILLHRDLAEWADLILVPSLLEEDFLCAIWNLPAAHSKTEEIVWYSSSKFIIKGATKDYEMPVAKSQVTEEECQISADTFKLIEGNLINKIKDTYTDALIGRGIPICGGKTKGKAFVMKHGRELENFETGGILVTDRVGHVFCNDIDKELAQKLIKQVIGRQVIFGEPEDMFNEFKSILEADAKGESYKGQHIEVADGLHAFRAVLRSARAAIFSRGKHGGEISAKAGGIPCISSCVGATENIATGQTIVVDADRGEVYDALRLQT